MTIHKVKDLMTPDPVLIEPSATLQEAAKKMKRINCGVLPVGTPKKLEGIITDRDIVTRAVSAGKDPAHEKVKTYMTSQVFACNEEDTLHDAAEKMKMHKVSRLVVKNHEGQVTGILSFGGILRQTATDIDVAGIVTRATSRLVA